MSTRPQLTITEAAEAAGVHRNTIRRYVERGRFAGATKSDDGWRIPVEDLLAAGLRLHAPGGGEEEAEPDEALSAELVELRHRLALVVAERDAALALAAEREREIERLMLIYRSLPAGPQPEARRRWWQR